MHLLLIGLSHRTAPLDVREQVDFHARGLDAAIRALASRVGVREAAIISTCNRAEVYAVCDRLDDARRDVATFISECHGVGQDALAPHLYALTDADAVRHLFRVAAGLDSLVVGEPQILGQVKDAHAAATAAEGAGPLLNRLFHSSFAVGKRVRTETNLGAGAVSVSFAAVALARKIFGDLAGRSVLVIGAGEMGKLTARHMKGQGVQQVTIVSRTLATAVRTADAIGGASAAPWSEIDALLGTADIVITATGASQPVLTTARLDAVMRPRRQRPLFIIDIAMPRDVEASAADLDQVFLYNIDDLQATVRENLARRTSEVTHADAIVDEEVQKFTSWLLARRAIPTVVALRQQFDQIRRAEVDRLATGLSPDMRARVDDITRLLVEKLLLVPTEQLKAAADASTVAAYADTLTRLFRLDALQDAVATPSDAEASAPRGRVEPFKRPQSR